MIQDNQVKARVVTECCKEAALHNFEQIFLKNYCIEKFVGVLGWSLDKLGFQHFIDLLQKLKGDVLDAFEF